MTVKDLSELGMKYGLMCQKCVVQHLPCYLADRNADYCLQYVRRGPGHHDVHPEPPSAL